jgi:hypothetical protein
MMEGVTAFETSVSFYHATRRNIPEDSEINTRCCENFKFRLGAFFFSGTSVCWSSGRALI